MNSSPTPEGSGSVSGAPNLPAGLADTFTSHYIDTGELRLHAVTGGDSPPLLLVRGWPQTWYAWRMLMPTLASASSASAPIPTTTQASSAYQHAASARTSAT